MESTYWTSRGMNRRGFLRSAAVTGVGAAAFLAGCKSASETTPTAGGSGASSPATALFRVPEGKDGGTITESFAYEPTGFDPHSSPGAGQGPMLEANGIKLIRHDYRKTPPYKNGAETLIMGELAEKWESPDPLTYNFTLRQGINWPDQEPMKGKPITAKDVEYTFKHAKGPDAVVQSYVFDPIDSVKAIDDKTVQFKIKSPNFLFLSSMNTYSTQILPQGMYEWTGPGAWSSDKSRGGGPWILDDYQPGSFVSYKPNPAYRKVFGVPYADKMILKILVGSSALNLQAFVGKQIYQVGATGGNINTIKTARPDAKSNLDVYAASNTNALFLNQTQKPFDDVRVRRAISMSVDRDGWGKTLQLPYKLESGPITWGFEDWKMGLDKMPAEVNQWAKYNVAEATKLVQAAGVSSSTNFQIHMYPYNESYTPEATLLINALKGIGIQSSLKVYDYNNWIANVYYSLDPKAYSGMLYGPDNLDRLPQQLADRFSKTSNRNHAFINDSTMEKLLVDFAASKGPDDAKLVANNIQQRSVDQAYATYRPQPTSPIFWDPSVQNYEGQREFLYQNSYRSAFLWLNK